MKQLDKQLHKSDKEYKESQKSVTRGLIWLAILVETEQE